MKYKLIDIISSTEKVEFGTCDLCMYVGDLTTESYAFEDEKGEKVKRVLFSNLFESVSHFFFSNWPQRLFERP